MHVTKVAWKNQMLELTEEAYTSHRISYNVYHKHKEIIAMAHSVN